MKKVKSKNLLTVTDLTQDEIELILNITGKLKKKNKKYLKNKTLGMIFEKNSTRTRVSFETGIYQLGGIGLFLSNKDLQLGRGETIHDTAKVLSRYLDGIMIRAYSHSTVAKLAKYSSIPVINGLTDLYHPCQSLADFFTISEYKKNLKNLKLTFIGDGNNVANSLLLTAAMIGMDFAIASPAGYEIKDDILSRAKEIAKNTGSSILITNDVKEAAADADILYTDVWISMGQENEADNKVDLFKNYKIDNQLLQIVKENVIVMHCLPAHRGEEITAEIIDGKHSVVWAQAENRLHTQKAIMSLLMK